MDEYISGLDKSKEFLADYVKEAQNQIYITDDVVEASKKARKAQEDHNAAIKAGTLSAKAANIVLGALSTIGNMAISFVISKVIELVASMASAKQNMLDSAKEIGTSLKDNQTDIKSYKDRINDLHGIINNSSSSIEQVTQARKDLLSIQNEMIAKYGTEKETVESVTDSINGQTEALNNLSEDDYFKKKNEFNTLSFGEKANNFVAELGESIQASQDPLYNFHPHKRFDELSEEEKYFNTDYSSTMFDDKFSSMVASMEYSYVDLKKTGNDLLDSLIQSTYDLEEVGDSFRIKGFAGDVADKLSSIQSMALNFDVSSSFTDSMSKASNHMDELLSSNQEFYNSYILTEKILNDTPGNPYSDLYNDINNAKEAYNEAFTSNDESALEQATADYAQIVTNAIAEASEAGEIGVADYFRNMYPELQEAVGSWKLEDAFTQDTDNIKDSITKALNTLNFKTNEDIMGFNASTATAEEAAAYGVLTNAAETYGLTVQQLTDNLTRMDMVKDAAYERLYSKFGDGLDKLSADDLQYAFKLDQDVLSNIDDVDALTRAIERYKKQCQGIEPLNNIFSFTDNLGQSTQLSKVSGEIDNLQSAYNGLTDIMDNYEQTGSISIDQIQQIMSYGSNYLQYLVDENGNLTLNKQALEDVTAARIEDMKYQSLAALISYVQNIKNETDALKFLENQLYSTADAHEDNAAQALNDWYANALQDNILTEELAGQVVEKARGIADAIQALYQNLGDSSKKEVEKAGSAARSATEVFEEEISVLDAKMDTAAIDFSTYMNSRLSLIQNYYDQGKISADQYYSYLNSNYEKQLSYMDKVVSAVTNRFDREIDSINDTIESIEKQNEALEKQKDNYEKTISAVSDYYQLLIDNKQASIDGLEEQNSGLEELIGKYDIALNVVQEVYTAEQDALRAEQDAIQEKINALKEANEEKEKQISLEQSQYALEQAQRMKTRKVYDKESGQYVFKQDYTAIREAQKNLEDLETQAAIDAYQEKIDSIQTKIDGLEENKNAWSESSNAYDKAQNEQTAREIFGDNYKDYILNSSPEDIAKFQQNYTSAKSQVDANKARIDAYNLEIKTYQDSQKQWNDMTSNIEKNINQQIANMILGSDWQQEINEGRFTAFDEFKNSYLGIDAQLNSNQALIDSYNEKISYYQNLKDQWSSIAQAYETSTNDQIAKMFLGENWEADVLDDRLETLTSFQAAYTKLQNAAAQVAWNTANEQIRAAKEAAKAENGHYGSAKNIGVPLPDLSDSKRYQVMDRNGTLISSDLSYEEARNLITRNSKNSEWVIISYHNGLLGKYPGLTDQDRYSTIKQIGTRKLSPDEFLAVLQKKELVITSGQQNQLLSNIGSLGSSLMTEQLRRTHFIHSPALLPGSTSQAFHFTTGDIHVHGVNDAYSLADQIVKQLPNAMYQKAHSMRRKWGAI